MAARPTSVDRMRRLLSIVPWIAQHDGPRIADVCERFHLGREELLADLDVVFMVGIPPYTPDTLIEVFTEDERVWIHLGEFFRRPLRLTTQQGLALLTAGAAVASTPGADPDGPLAHALAKVGAALGASGAAPLDVELGAGDQERLDLLRDAVTQGRQIRVDYYTAGRDDHGVRVVEPHRLYSRDGSWYLLGWCHQAEGQRVFRVDRIRSIEVLGLTVDRTRRLHDDGYVAGSEDHRVTVSLPASARWVTQQFPVERLEEKDGRIRVTFAVSGPAFLARLLLRFGADATVVAVDGSTQRDAIAGMRSVGTDVAARVLGRYR